MFGKKGVYDTALEAEESRKKEELSEQNEFEKDRAKNFFAMKKAYNGRLFETITNGTIEDLTDADEIRTVKILREEILREIENDSVKRQTAAFDFAAFGDEIIVEIVGRDEFEFVCQIPKNSRPNLTLETLSGDIRRIGAKIGKNLRFVNAFSSLNREISANLPLLPQLGNENKMFLLFEEK